MDPIDQLRQLREHDDRWENVRYVAPSRRKVQRSRWPQLVVPVAVGLSVGLLAWAGISHLNNPDLQPSQDTAGPAVTAEVTSPPVLDDGKYLGGNATRLAWTTETADFPKDLPVGVKFPDSPPTGLLKPNSATAPGVVNMLVAQYWVCAWEGRYLDASDASDASGVVEALDHIDEFADLPAVKENYPSEPEWYDAVIAPALSGDLEPMRYDFKTACPIIETD